MPQGKVKWFNNAKGYGFIIANEDEAELSNEDLFAHFSAIQMEGYKTLKAGQSVRFDVTPSGKGYHAVNIQPLDMLEHRDGQDAAPAPRSEPVRAVTGSVSETQPEQPKAALRAVNA